MRSPMPISPNELFKLLGDSSPGSSFGNHKSGKSFVFSVFNFKEKSRCTSEFVIRTDFDDLESSNAGQVSVVHYIKAQKEKHEAKLNAKESEHDESNVYIDYQQGSLNDDDQMKTNWKNIDIIFHIEGITYANGYISQCIQFTSQVDKIVVRLYIIANGNYEHNCFEIYDMMDFGGECDVLAESGAFWYSTDFGVFLCCIADGEHYWKEEHGIVFVLLGKAILAKPMVVVAFHLDIFCIDL